MVPKWLADILHLLLPTKQAQRLPKADLRLHFNPNMHSRFNPLLNLVFWAQGIARELYGPKDFHQTSLLSLASGSHADLKGGFGPGSLLMPPWRR
jgi:hypothetical protein